MFPCYCGGTFPLKVMVGGSKTFYWTAAQAPPEIFVAQKLWIWRDAGALCLIIFQCIYVKIFRVNRGNMM